MYPWKIWQTTSDPMGSSAKAIDFFMPGNNSAELMAVFQKFSEMADEYSGIPRYMTGLAGGDGGWWQQVTRRTRSLAAHSRDRDARQVQFHYDVGDGHFVEPIIIGPIVLQSIERLIHGGG